MQRVGARGKHNLKEFLTHTGFKSSEMMYSSSSICEHAWTFYDDLMKYGCGLKLRVTSML